MTRRNPQARVAFAWAVVAAAGAAGAVLPSILAMDGANGGHALMFAGGLLALCGVVVAVVFGFRARVLSRLLSGSGVLAHWTYSPEATGDHLARRFAEERRVCRSLFLVVSALSVSAALLVGLADPEGGRFAFLVLLGATVTLAAVAELAPRLRHARRRRAVQEAIVSREGAYVFGMLHIWSRLGARIEDIGIVPAGTPVLRVDYSAPMLYGRQVSSVVVPVPAGEERLASELARSLQEWRRDPDVLR